jgi:ferredoxin
MYYFNVLPLTLLNFIFILFIFSSFSEKNPRLFYFNSLFLFINSSFWIGSGYLSCSGFSPIFNNLALLLFLVFIIISMIHWFPQIGKTSFEKFEQFDERDHVFSRNNSYKNAEISKKYYEIHPEKKTKDDKIFTKIRMGEPGGKYYDKSLTPMVNSSFDFIEYINKFPLNNILKNKNKNKKLNTKNLKYLAKMYGAVDVGIVKLKSHHFYSKKGRNIEKWGEKIENHHKYGIVLVFPRDLSMVKTAPLPPAFLNSAQSYVQAAVCSQVLSKYINESGYESKPHTDGNYEILCVPAAKDCGLGEVSLSSLFLHPEYGTGVRLSVVSTNMELKETKRKNHQYIIHFCNLCKKCFKNCPSKAIPEFKPEKRGFTHWSVDENKCYSYWRFLGTDCGICMKVCPFSKPYNLIHNFIRWYISRNRINQKITLFFENLIYKRK